MVVTKNRCWTQTCLPYKRHDTRRTKNSNRPMQISLL